VERLRSGLKDGEEPIQIGHVLPGFLLGDFDNQRQLIWRFDDIREEAQGMDGKDSGLFCGVICLQINGGITVAVRLDIAIDGFFNHRLKRCAVLHSTLCWTPRITRLATTADLLNFCFPPWSRIRSI